MEPLMIAAAAALLTAVCAVVTATRRRRSRGAYPGDFTGRVTVVYSPAPDGRPDPGEVVWTWVPFDEDPARGKDRPVLLIGRDGPWLLALALSSSRPAHHEHGRRGPRWESIGSGDWDPQGRRSDVRLDRIIRVAPGDVRREGAVLDRRRFDAVARSLSRAQGW